MKMLCTTLLYLSLSILCHSQTILLDGDFSDWSDVSTRIEEQGDINGLDLESLAITNDDQFFYLHMVFSQEILLQENNQLELHLSGQDFEFEFQFGEMTGRIIQSGQDPIIYHNDAQMLLAPSYTSKQFELRFARTWTLPFSEITLPEELKVQLINRTSEGDLIPDEPLAYKANQSNIFSTSPVDLNQVDGTMRVCTYNVLRDNLFDNELRIPYSKILSAISADIYCFQEIYDHDSQETLSRMFNIFGVLNGSNWYHAKQGSDNIIISRYPITYETRIAGNGVFEIERNGQKILIINIHLSCCEKDSQREREIDDLLTFLRAAKAGQGNFNLADNTPIIIMGDTNFVGNGDQITALTTGDFFSSGSTGPDFEIDWDGNGLSTLDALTTGRNAQYTWFSAFSRYAPGRLDYIFYSDSRLKAENAFTLDTKWMTSEELFSNGLERNSTQQASDHLPVVCDFSIIPVLATEDEEQLSRTLFPNPTHGNLHISDCQNCEWKLYDLTSQEILSGQGDQVDMSRLPTGLYHIEILSRNHTEVQLVVRR